MINERTQIAIKLIASHIVLLTGLIITSVFTKNCDFLFLSIAQTVLLILYFSGYWEFFGLKFKWIFCSLSEIFLLMIFAHKIYYGVHAGGNIYLLLILSLIQAYLFIELIKIFIVINKEGDLAIDIEFPFKNGTYLITDGGNSRISRPMNYHYYSPTHKKNNTNKSMLYATDIIKINNGKLKWLPLKNADYSIFNENIYSPIAGRIVKVENDLPDNEPWSGNYPYNTGNTVVIQKDDYFLLLGHLKKDSIVVKEGDIVQANDLIGTAGNSGWTERPHLHMQLMQSDTINYWYGMGICIRFKNKNLFKNRLIKN